MCIKLVIDTSLFRKRSWPIKTKHIACKIRAHYLPTRCVRINVYWFLRYQRRPKLKFKDQLTHLLLISFVFNRVGIAQSVQ